jgi:hypothetical protein
MSSGPQEAIAAFIPATRVRQESLVLPQMPHMAR